MLSPHFCAIFQSRTQLRLFYLKWFFVFCVLETFFREGTSGFCVLMIRYCTSSSSLQATLCKACLKLLATAAQIVAYSLQQITVYGLQQPETKEFCLAVAATSLLCLNQLASFAIQSICNLFDTTAFRRQSQYWRKSYLQPSLDLL